MIRYELLVLGSALLIQFLYMHFYESHSSTSVSQAAPGVEKDGSSVQGASETQLPELIEVNEYLSADCHGPPARVWRIPPVTKVVPSGKGAEAELPCIAIRPQMTAPGESASRTLAENLYGN